MFFKKVDGVITDHIMSIEEWHHLVARVEALEKAIKDIHKLAIVAQEVSDDIAVATE